MTSMGRIYFNGVTDFPKNEVKALEWFRKAAQAGDVDGIFRVGSMYYMGKGGVAENNQMAIQWFRRASKAGHQEAKKILKEEFGIE